MFARSCLFSSQRYIITTRSTFCSISNKESTSNLSFPLHPPAKLKTENPSGWAPPLGTLSNDIPFHIYRTENKQLPVYHAYRKHNTQFITILRKYRRDASIIQKELRNLLGNHIKMKKYAGRIEIQGDFRKEIHTWLRQLGF